MHDVSIRCSVILDPVHERRRGGRLYGCCVEDEGAFGSCLWFGGLWGVATGHDLASAHALRSITCAAILREQNFA